MELIYVETFETSTEEESKCECDYYCETYELPCVNDH